VTSPGPVPVAVAGAGVKTPAGNDAGELWENLCAGRPSAEVFSDDRLPPGTAAHALSGPLAGQKFGRKGTRLRFFATGLGHKLNDAPTAQLEIAGNWSIE